MSNKSQLNKRVSVYIYSSQGQAPFTVSAYILLGTYWCSFAAKSGLQNYVGNQGENVIDAVFSFDSKITIPNDSLLSYNGRYYHVTAVVAKQNLGLQEVYAAYADDAPFNFVSGSAVLPSGSQTFSVTVDFARTASFVLGSIASASYAAFAVSASYAPSSPQISSSYAATASVALNVPTTSSYALKSLTADSATSASYALSSSFATSASWAPQLAVVSASYAGTASVAPNYLPLAGGTLTGELTSSGNIAVISAIPLIRVKSTANNTAGIRFAVNNTADTGIVGVGGNNGLIVGAVNGDLAIVGVNKRVLISTNNGSNVQVTVDSGSVGIGISGSTPQAQLHVAQFVSASGFIGGGAGVTGIVSSSFATSASYAPQLPVVSASYATNAGSANSATSASYALSASWAPGSGASVSASYALTASFATSASYAPQQLQVSSSYAATASLLLGSVASALTAISSSYSATASLLLGSVASALTATSASYASTASVYLGSVVSSSYSVTSSNTTATTFPSIALNGPAGATAAGVDQTQQTSLDIYGKATGTFGGISTIRLFPSGSPYTGSTTGNWSLFALADNFLGSQAMRRGNFEFYNVLKLTPAFIIDSSSRMGIGTGYNQPFLAELTIFGATPAQPILLLSASLAQTADVFQIKDAANIVRFKVDSNYNTTSNLIGSASSAVSASYALSASYAPQLAVVSASYAGTASLLLGSVVSASFALSASYAPGSPSISSSYAGKATLADTATSASYALTASYALNGGTGASNGVFGGAFSGSFSGSVSITGSLLGNASTATSASFATNAIGATTAQSASYVLNAVSASYATSASWAPQLPVVSASYAQNAGAANTATSASYALSASWAPQLAVVSSSYAATSSVAVRAIAASNATTSSYALIAQSLLGAIANATSASYAVTASYAQTFPNPFIWITGSYTASNADGLIFIYAQTGTASVYLPDVASNAALSLLIRSVGVNTNPVVVVPHGTDTIERLTAVVLNNKYDTIAVTSNGHAEWLAGPSGSFNGQVISASFATSASWAPGSTSAISASYALTASYAMNGGGASVSASYALTASYATIAQDCLGSIANATSASYAATASLAPKYLPLIGGTLSGDLNIPANNIRLGPANDIIQGSGGGAAGLRVDSMTGVSLCYNNDATLGLRVAKAGTGISGSLQVSGSINVLAPYTVSASAFSGSGAAITGIVSSSYALSASWAPGSGASISASYALTASYASVAQNVLGSITTAATSSYLLSGSIAGDATASAGLNVVGGLNVGGTLRVGGGFWSATSLAIPGTISAGTGSITGNFVVGGAINTTSVTGSYKGDGSQVTGVVSSSYALSASWAPGGAGSFLPLAGGTMTGPITQTIISTPSTPASASIAIYANQRNGRALHYMMNDSGQARALENSLQEQRVVQAISAGVTTISQMGTSFAIVGTPGNPAIASTNRFTMANRNTWTTAATPATACNATSQRMWWVGSVTGSGGFDLFARISHETDAASTRYFFGLANTATPIATSGEPGTLTTAKIGIGLDSTDTNYQLVSNAAGATPSKVDLGIARASGTAFDLYLYAQPGIVGVHYQVLNATNGSLIGSGFLTTGIPSGVDSLAFHCSGYTVAASSIIAVGMTRMIVASDY